ncbi:MAG: OprD family outer membrane porin [Saprospiraceae bacterium]|nr:OprD family outer membrane porin [Saprospiraceae bacterium]MDZ4750762.1 OprD family outer membrane porin [Flavobacteriales bacterium]
MHLRILLFLFWRAGPVIALAQHQEISEAPLPYKGKEQIEKDSLSILSAFKHGKANGHFRYFFMATNNSGDLTDYYANAAGGGIRFETASFYGFRFAVGGSYVFNIASSDLTDPDSTTSLYSRYEVGLFDVDDPAITTGLDRLEELYLSYSWGQSEVMYGRQFINTPFINLQDGRMRPGAVEGIVLRLKEWHTTSMESGFLYAVSPRSTDSWYAVENSFGIYPSGINPDGSKSNYHGHIQSSGILYTGVTGKWFKKLTIQGWDFLALNVMNTAMLQLDLTEKTNSKDVIAASAQVIRQDGIGDGGNENASQAYFPSNAKSFSFGFRFGYTTGRFFTNLNYSRITSSGRYLMPREWGRDPLFTFLPRERNEGLGDVHAVMGRVAYTLPENIFSVGVSAGYYNLPDVKNTRLNKYGLPSYVQANLELRYFFKGLFEGLDIQYLLAAKFNAGETYDNDRYVFNKVNMQVHNLVLNFHF